MGKLCPFSLVPDLGIVLSEGLAERIGSKRLVFKLTTLKIKLITLGRLEWGLRSFRLPSRLRQSLEFTLRTGGCLPTRAAMSPS